MVVEKAWRPPKERPAQKRERNRTKKWILNEMANPAGPADLVCEVCKARFHGRMTKKLHVATFHSAAVKGMDSKEYLIRAALRSSNEDSDGEWKLPAPEVLDDVFRLRAYILNERIVRKGLLNNHFRGSSTVA